MVWLKRDVIYFVNASHLTTGSHGSPRHYGSPHFHGSDVGFEWEDEFSYYDEGTLCVVTSVSFIWNDSRVFKWIYSSILFVSARQWMYVSCYIQCKNYTFIFDASGLSIYSDQHFTVKHSYYSKGLHGNTDT